MAAGLGAQAQRLGAGGERSGALSRSRDVVLLVGAYLAVGTIAAGIAVTLGYDPLTCDAWLGTGGTSGVLLSAGAGLSLGATTIAASRVLVRRVAWARALHSALRPLVRGAGGAGLLALALASGVGEELLFRGLLLPILGLFVSSALFGALHQIRGPARWGWMVWASIMGLLFGGLFVATGSLAGPIVGHAMINAYNLRFLRDNDPSPRRRPLGGLLRRSL